MACEWIEVFIKKGNVSGYIIYLRHQIVSLLSSAHFKYPLRSSESTLN